MQIMGRGNPEEPVDPKPVWVTPSLHKSLAQKRYVRSIKGHQETLCRFQDFTVCLIRFYP